MCKCCYCLKYLESEDSLISVKIFMPEMQLPWECEISSQTFSHCFCMPIYAIYISVTSQLSLSLLSHIF